MSMLVNDCGMSPALYAAIKRRHEGYTRTGYLSTTSCVDSPRIRVLTQRHDSEIVIPASTLIPSFVGNCVHSEIERYDRNWEIDGIAQEKEFTIEVMGIVFSGRPDWYDLSNEEVGDEKTASVWSYTFNPGGKKEHLSQININGYLIRRAGYPCTRGWVEMIFLDWKLSSAQRDQRYPARVERITVPKLWEDDYTLRFIEDRVSLHLAADSMSDNNLPLCTEEEQWRKPHTWSVIKKGNTRATKNCDTLEEAETIARGIGRTAMVEERQGERTRCEFHCHVQRFCNQYSQEKGSV